MANKLLDPSFFDNSPANNPDADVALLEEQANVRAVADFVGAKPPQTAVILDGVVTPTGAFCKVGTEGESPADDLARINATRTADDVIHEGMVLHLCALDDAQVVTVKHSADIILADGVDVVLSTDRYIVLQYIQGVWREVQISMGVDVKTAIAVVQNTFSTVAAVGKAPVAIADPETGIPVFDESWDMGNDVTQTINPDPEQASAETVPSEKAVSTSLQSKANISYVDEEITKDFKTPNYGAAIALPKTLNSTYTVPSDGYVYSAATTTSTNFQYRINDGAYIDGFSQITLNGNSLLIPVKLGDILKVVYVSGDTTKHKYYYLPN